MGDKNQIIEVTCSDTLVKTGHAVIKAIYAQPGDRAWIIRDGTTVAGAVVMTITANANNHFEAPYINHPVRDGLFIDNTTSGTTGTLVVVYE